MAKYLTDSVVASQTPQRGRVGWREIADGATRGLCLRISPRGEKIWAVRHVIGGKRSRHTIGAYDMSPEEVDASVQALVMTVKQAHASYLEVMAGATRASTRKLKETMFRAHIDPIIGTRLIRTIRRADLVGIVSTVAGKGFAVQANRVFSRGAGEVGAVRSFACGR